MFCFMKKFVSQLKTAGLLKGSLNTLCILALVIIALKETGSYIHLRLLKVSRLVLYSSKDDLYYDNRSKNI